MPFAGYKDFADCVAKNKGKVRDPEAYCATLQRRVESGRQAPTNGKGSEPVTETETPPKSAAHTGWWKGHL